MFKKVDIKQISFLFFLLITGVNYSTAQIFTGVSSQEFSLKRVLDREFYLPGDTVNGRIFNLEEKDEAKSLSVALYDSSGQNLGDCLILLNTHGAIFNLVLPINIQSGVLALTVTPYNPDLVDQKPIITKPVHIFNSSSPGSAESKFVSWFPVSGKIVQDLPNDIILERTAIFPEIDSVYILNEENIKTTKVSFDENGRALISGFIPLSGNAYFIGYRFRSREFRHEIKIHELPFSVSIKSDNDSIFLKRHSLDKDQPEVQLWQQNKLLAVWKKDGEIKIPNNQIVANTVLQLVDSSGYFIKLPLIAFKSIQNEEIISPKDEFVRFSDVLGSQINNVATSSATVHDENYLQILEQLLNRRNFDF